MENSIEQRLVSLGDAQYRDFTCKLIPTLNPSSIAGVRVGDLRALAASLKNTPQAEAFLRALPHRLYEENNLHGLLISQFKEYDASVRALDEFLPYVDNWATCDLISPAAFKKRPPALIGKIRAYLDSPLDYTVRFGLEMLMSLYLDEAFDAEYLNWAAGVRREGYYVRMMVAWYFATALAKQYSAALPFLQQGRLDTWVHNKTIQKAVESRRIAPEHKAVLRALRRR